MLITQLRVIMSPKKWSNTGKSGFKSKKKIRKSRMVFCNNLWSTNQQNEIITGNIFHKTEDIS